MNIAQKDVALAKRVAEEKMKEFSVKIKPEDLEDYKLTLKNISKNHSYAEGENLSFDDSDILVKAARKIIKGMENTFYNIPDDEKRKANVAGMIMAANDYMMTLAMEELNSPTIHDYCTDQLKVIYRATASRLVGRKPRKGYFISDAFENQRGMNAEELIDYKVGSLIKAMKDNPDDMDKGAELYVEYQALAKRQENHGAIWRFFHRKENDARTALLNEMKEVMADKISKETLRDRYTILESQRGISAEKLKNDRINALINALNADPDNMEKVADLYAEYQALAKRQENHGAIWRFFNRKENDERTALLNEMKEAMAGKVSEKYLNDLYAFPSSIIHNADEEASLNAIEEGLTSREMNPEKGFDYFKYKNQSNEQLPDPSEISKSTSVEETKIEIADNTIKIEEQPKEEIVAEESVVEEPVVEEPVVEEPVVENPVVEEPKQETKIEEHAQEPKIEENKTEELDEIGYENKYNKASTNQKLEETIKSQIVDILKTKADIGEYRLPDKADHIFENTLHNAHDHCEAMDNEYSDAARDDLMRDFAKNLFENTYMYVRDAHIYDDDNIVHRVIAAQNITNLILDTYTPVKFDADKYGKYADNYALNNEEALRGALENLYEDCVETDEAFAKFMEDLNAARLAQTATNDEEEVEQTEEEVEKENEETKIEAPVQETKIEEPQTQVQTETVVEKNVEEPAVEEPVQEIKTEEPVVEEIVVEETVVEEPVQEIKTEEPTVEKKSEVQSEEEAAKKQAEAEETQKKLEEIKNNVQQITVTDDNFKELFEVAKNDTALEAKVRVELEAVLNEVYTGAYVHDNATSILYTATTIPNLFPDGQFTTEDSNIGGMVFEIFDDAYNKLDSAKVDIDQKIILAQKITDIVVRNYPPVCHDIDGFSKFADNYIINGTTLYSQDKLKEFLKEKEIPEEEIEAHVSRINGAVAKSDDIKEERYEPEELDNPFKHGPNYIHQNKAEAPKINRFKPRRLFGQGDGELYSAGRHQARKEELERLRAYDQEAMDKTEAIAEDALEYLEDIEEENVLEETAIETNENEIVTEPENKEEEPEIEEISANVDEIANNLVANALSDAMAELEEEQKKQEEQSKVEKPESQPIPMPVVPEGHLIDPEEAEKNNDEMINNFVDDVFASAEAEIAEEQRKNDEMISNFVDDVFASAEAEIAEEQRKNDEMISNFVDDVFASAEAEIAEEQRKAEEEARRKAEEEEARRRAEEEAKRKAEEEAAFRKAAADAKKVNIILRNMCDRRVRDAKIAVETRQQLFEIFRNPRYEDKQLMTCVNMANEIPQNMADQFEKARYDLLTPQGVERMTKSVFREALYCTEESGFNLETRIGMAQRITDLMMKDYSVAAFIPTEFGTYADNYIVLNKGILKDLIKDQTSNLSENEVSDLMKRVDREMARELSGWNARDIERRFNSLVLPYEEIYEKIVGDKAPELKEVRLEEFRNFKAQYNENLKNSELTANVKAQIAQIYAEAGLKDSKLEAATNAAFNDFVEIMTETYDDLQTHTEYLATAKKMMTYTAEATLHYVFASAHSYINDMSERLVISQRITDVLLNNYSPAAFVNGDLDKFADNYITISNDRLDDWMRSFYYGGDSKDRASIIKNVEKLMNRAKDDFVEEEINDEPEEIDEDDIDDIEDEIEETPKVEEKPKAEEKYERKVVDKYERKVEGIDLPANGIVGNAEINFFRDECNKSVADPQLTEYVKSQIGGILADSGVSESKILKTVDNIFDKCLGKKGMIAFYDKSNSLSVHNIKAEAMMSNVVKHSAKFLSNATDGCFSSLEEGFVVNQKILDVILKNYSPVAFAKDDLSKYANNYLLDNETVIAGYYQTFVNRNANVNDMNAFVAKVQETREKANREKIAVDLSASAETKADAPKTEASQTATVKVEEPNPLKERIVLDEFSVKASDKDVSAKVEENDAPVVSNVKE